MNNSNSEECALAECHVMSKFLCSGCTVVNYCCEGHQKSDWKYHKKVCSPLTLEISTALGRHYVASRNLKAGTLLISEFPLLVEPIAQQSGSLDLVEEAAEGQVNPSICLACCGPAGDKKCPKCEWPICSIECSETKIHAENECQIFLKNSLKMDKTDDQDILTGVFLIRAMLLKKSQPQLWAKIQSMQSENSDKTQYEFRAKFQKLEKEFGLGKDFFDMKELTKLYGVQLLNSFTHRSDSDQEDKPFKGYRDVSRNLYLKSSMFSHACFPNCFYTTSSCPDFKIEIRTAVDIAKGQILSIDYNTEDVLGSMEHNLNEMMIGSFNCFCARCVDPTELNSMMSAVKCKKGDCQDGYLIPHDPKNLLPSSIWTCVKCGDRSTETWGRIKHMTQITENMTKKFQLFEPKKIEDLLTTLRKHLHPNHWVIQRFCKRVLKELEEKLNSGIIDEDVLDYYVKIIFYLLHVFHLTMPGLNFRKSDVQCKLLKAFDTKLCVMERIGKEYQVILMMNEMGKLFDEILKIKKFDTRFRTNDGQWKRNMLGLIAIKEKLQIR